MNSLLMRLIFSALIFLPIHIAFRLFLLLFIKKQKFNWAREVVLCVFSIFMVGLLSLVFQPGQLYYEGDSIYHNIVERVKSGTDINVNPFFTIKQFFQSGYNTQFTINIIANILMFSPLGFCLPLLWERWKKGWKVIFIGLLFSVTIELIQMFIGRSVDIDDVLLNTLGVAVGYAVFYAINRATGGKINLSGPEI